SFSQFSEQAMEYLFFLFYLFHSIFAFERFPLQDGFDLEQRFPTGTIITIMYQNTLNCGKCESNIRLFFENRQDLFPDALMRDFPVRIKISNDPKFPVESDSKEKGQIDCRKRSHTYLERNPDLEGMWRIDIVKVSSNELRIFFQGYPSASIHSSQSLDSISSLLFHSEVAGDDQYIDVIYPNSQLPQMSVSNWQNGDNRVTSQVVSNDGSFPIGARFRFVAFMNSYENTNTYRSVGLRLKHQSMRTPIAVMQSWHEGHQRISLHSKDEYDDYSKNMIICFDGFGLGDFSHFDITRVGWSRVKLRVFHVRSTTVECELNLPQLGKDLDQELQVAVSNGASLLYLIKSQLSVPY
ncbi:hypothetical protein PFISCL1PPCAC_10729, partial [Pristionchus fissidentatus]